MKQSVIKIQHCRHSIRLKGYDYSQPGYYFVTICTKNRIRFFAQPMVEGAAQLTLNKLGQIALQTWLEIPAHFSNIRLDEFSIMPNHVHGIIVIPQDKEPDFRSFRFTNETSSTPRQYQLLPVVVGSFKSAVTKRINRFDPEVGFRWQKFYYDHIVRNKESLERIRTYIRANPNNWLQDIENLYNDDAESRNHYQNLMDGSIT